MSCPKGVDPKVHNREQYLKVREDPTWREKNRLKAAKWYAKHKEYATKRSRRYVEANKERTAAYQAAYRAKNQDRLRAQKAAWQRASEKSKASSREWGRTHRKEISARTAQRRRDNLEVALQREAAYREANREKIRETLRAWKRRNPEKLRQRDRIDHRRRKLRKRNALVGISPAELRRIDDWEKGWRSAESVACHWCCGRLPGVECQIDHVMPISLGGEHVLNNLVVACKRCNATKRNMHPDAWVARLARLAA